MMIPNRLIWILVGVEGRAGRKGSPSVKFLEGGFFPPSFILCQATCKFPRFPNSPVGAPQWTQESCPDLHLAVQALCPPGDRRLQATQAQSGVWALGGQQWWSQRGFDTKSQPFVSQAFYLGKLKAIFNHHVLQDLSPHGR